MDPPSSCTLSNRPVTVTGLVLPMIDNSIAAARASTARILLPGTIYNYGPNAYPVLREDAPQHPLTRKGAIRVELERPLAEASHNNVRTIVLRAGDFFGAGQQLVLAGSGQTGPAGALHHLSRRARS